MTKGHLERGSSLPETVIAMAAVLAILFGIIDFGRALYTYDFVATLAREGARWAIVRGSQCSTNSPNLSGCGALQADVQTYVRSLSEGATVPTSISLNSSATMWPGTGCASGSPKNSPGCLVVVTVTYPFTFMPFPFLPKASISMTSTSEMTISQ
jgi:Flp pilus assembly protein TadG